MKGKYNHKLQYSKHVQQLFKTDCLRTRQKNRGNQPIKTNIRLRQPDNICGKLYSNLKNKNCYKKGKEIICSVDDLKTINLWRTFARRFNVQRYTLSKHSK